MARIDKEALMRHAVRRAAGRDAYIASALAIYQAAHQMDDTMLADTLGCPVSALPRLALCLKPDLESSRFRDDVLRIAQYAGVQQPLLLVNILREAENAATMRRVAEASGGLLAAARDAAIPESEIRETGADYDAGDGQVSPSDQDRSP